MLLDARTLSLASRTEEVGSALPDPLAAMTTAGGNACVIELRTRAHVGVPALAAELTRRRASLDHPLRERLGLCTAAAGTHPLALGSEVAVAADVHHRRSGGPMRALGGLAPTMTLHVHVAVPGGRLAVQALDGLRSDLPLLLSLSANSPFWRGADSGFASFRTPVLAMFPHVGIPRRFGSYRAYVRLVEAMLHSGAVADPGRLWWDVRLRPRLGTVEVRVMDAQSRVADVATLAALVQCLVRSHAEGPPARAVAAELLAANRFLASRDGISAWFVAGMDMPRRPAADALAEMIEGCLPAAVAMGCTEELAAAAALADDTGYARQRLMAARDGVGAVPAALVGAYRGARRYAAA